MRTFIACIALLSLAACGQSSTSTTASTSTAPSAPAWQAALTDNPRLVQNYAAGFGALADSTITSSHDSVHITTARAVGSWSGELPINHHTAVGENLALRLTAKVDTGALVFLMTRTNAPAGFQPFQLTVQAGAARTVLLPLQTDGDALLVVANGNGQGSSSGTVSAIALVGPPAPATH